MVKLIHTGDIKIGKSFNFLHESLREENRTCIKQALFRLIKYAKEREVDAVIINGDLFSSNYPVEEDVKFAADIFSSISGIKVFIVPGEHDYLCLERMKNTLILPKNVHIFDKSIASYRIKEGVFIHGIGYSRINGRKNLKDMVQVKKEKNEINILCFYGHENSKKEDNGPFYKGEGLADLGFDYIAIGSEQSFRNVVNIGNTIMAAYAGSLVATDFCEEGENKGFIYLEADKQRSNFEYIESEVNNFSRLEIDVTGRHVEEIIQEVNQNLNSKIYEIVLKGEMDICEYIDMDKLKDMMDNYRITNVVDKIKLSHVEEGESFSKRAKEIFIKNIMESLKTNSSRESLYKKVLLYGLTAMESRGLG